MTISKKLKVVTEREILKEVAKELNISEKNVGNTYKIWLDYLDHISSNTDQSTLNIPKLGQMYISVHKMRRLMNTDKLKKFKERKLREIAKLEGCENIVHEKSVPIILKYGISKRNSIPYLIGKSETSEFYTPRELVEKQNLKFIEEDYEFRENKNIEKYIMGVDE